MTTTHDDQDAPPEGGLGFQAPHDLDAEQAVLGAMMLDRKVIDDVAQIVKGRHYYRPVHETIHETILELHAAGEVADPITVHAALERRGEAARCNSPAYLHDLIGAVPTAANAEHYAEIIREKYVARDFAQTTMRATRDLLAGQQDPSAVMAEIQAHISAAESEQAEDGLHLMSASMESTFDYLEAIAENKGKITGVPTGFTDLDHLTQGWHGGQFILIAGRPAMGKTTFGLDLLRAAAIRHHLPSVIFSLEMGRNEINMKILSAESRVGLHLMRSGAMEDDDWTRLARRMPEVSAGPLFIDDSPNLTLADVRAKCRRLREKHDLRLVVIDYLQLLQAGTSRRFESRQVEVSYISRNLKLLAKELDVPVIALSQLNRGPEQRADKKPAVSDLRESGSLEQDADLVILLHREDAYEKDSPRSGEADLIVGKHRNGATGTITIASQLHYSRFVSMQAD